MHEKIERACMDECKQDDSKSKISPNMTIEKHKKGT